MKNNYSYEGKLTTRLRQWWLMLTAAVLLTLTIGLQTSNAQSITNYAFSASSGAFTPIAGTGGSTNIPAIQADFGTSPFMPIGFNFLYNGVSYSQFFAHSDGYIGFGATAAGTAANNLNTGLTTSRPILAPYWEDLSGFGGVNPGIGTYATTGLPGSRILTVEFLNWRVIWNGPNALSFQVKLYEATGVIEFIYRQEGVPTAGTASVGISAAGTGAGNFLSLSDVTAAPTVSSATETTTINAIPASNQVYTFTPPVAPPAPTALTFSAVTNNSMTLDWVDAAGEVGYIVERSLDGINYTQVASLPANTITYAGAGLSAGTTYYWNVISFSEGNKSAALNSSQSTVAGTLCGTLTVGPTGTYASLTAALADIRTNGLVCSVILELQAAYVSSGETFPVWTGNIGTLASKTVTIRPELGATALNISSSNVLGTVLDSLTSYLIIDGRPGGLGTTSELTIQNVNNTASTTGGALRIVTESSNNTCNYVTFRGANTSTTGGVVILGGTTAGGSGNDNNSFDNCNIREVGTTFPVNCFYALGTAGSTNDNLSITNSNIFNFYSPSLATVGINVLANNTNVTITGNRIYQEASRSYGVGNIHKGIVCNTILSSANISNNIIGFASASGTGTYTMTFASGTPFANRFFGMDLNVANSPLSTISGNTISNFNIATNSAGTGSGAPFCGIWLNAGGANIANNTVGNMSGVDNILVRGTVTGGSATSANVIGIAQGAASNVATTVTGNNIGGLGFNGITAAFATAPTVGGTVCGIFNQGFTTLTDPGATRLISGNTIGGGVAGSLRAGNANQNIATMSANFSVLGILNTGGTRITISNNSIQNLQVPTRSTAGSVFGIQSTSGINVISGNTITALSSNAKNVNAATTAHLSGINHTSTTIPVAGTEVNISGNTIYNLRMSADTGRVVVNGIAYTGTATAGFNQLIQKNLIYDLNDVTFTNDTAKHVFVGIGLYGGLPTVQNNMIQLGLGNSSSQEFYGIFKANTNINKIYHNSVYIGGAATVASGVLPGNTFAFRRTQRPTSGNDEIINNVFYNARTSALGGLQYATALDSNINVTASKNVLFADFANGGRTGLRNLTVATSLADWKTLTGVDMTSISENPNYIAPSAATPDLHIQPSPAVTPVEGSGLAIAGPADDYDGQARAGLTPIDIGADAGNFVASGDYVSPVIVSVVASPAGSACIASSRLISADASDASGIAGVNLNWSLNGVVQTAIVMVFNGGNNLWEGTIPASGSALVSYSVTVTDNSANANTTTSASQSYRDEYLFAGLSAGADQTICPGTSTNLSVASPYLNSIVFSEISGFETGTGAGPLAPGISGFDYIELTNIGNQPVNISGWRLEITGTTAGVFIIPAGNTVAAGGTFTIARSGGGAAIPGVYVNSTLLSVGSGTSQGLIISDLGGNISDVVAINGGTPFNPVGTGTPAVTAAMWSGNVASSSGTAGIRRTAFSDSNTAADWTVASAGNLTNWGAFNVGLGNINVANISWSSGGTGSIENVTPVASPTQYVVTLNDGVCSATDTVNVSWFTTLAAPVGVDSMHCGNQQAKCDVFSVPGAIAYRWYTTPTGGTPVQNTADTSLLINVATTTTFYVAAFDGVCDGPRVAVTETVVQPDPIDVVSALGSSICLGQVDTLDVVQTGTNNTYLYTWSGNGVATLNVNSGPQVVSTPVTGGVYTFVVLGDDAAAGCVITDTLVLSVNNNPVVSTNITSATICLGESVSLTSSAYVVEGATGTPPTYLSSTATSTADEEILNVTFGSINQPSTCATTGGPGSVLNLYSNYTNLPPAIVAPGQVVPFSVQIGTCGGNFSNRTAIFIDYNQDGDFLDVGENAFLSVTAVGPNTVTGNITIPVTALGGVTRMRVINVETTGVINPTGTYTWGETEDYSILLASTSGLTYSWAPAAGLNDPNISNPIATPASSTTYVLTVEKTSTGCSSTANVQIDVLPVPNAPTTNNSAHCGNQIPTASVDPVAGATAYYWYDAATGGNILQASPSLTFLSPVGTTTTMYVAAFDGSCYSTRSAITITVATPPSIIASADDSTVCLGSTIALSSTANGYTDFAWSVNGNGNLLTNNTQNVSATPTSADTYNFIVTASGGTGPNAGCVTSDTVVVIVNNLPTILSINIADTTICQGQSTSVIASAIPSTVTTGPQTPPSGYLSSAATSTADEEIFNVTFGGINNSSNCGTTGGAGSTLSLYSNYTGLAPAQVQAGQTVPYSVTQTSCGGAFTNRTAIFIDYNRDGDFLDAGENPVLSPAVAGNNTASGSIVIPFTASAGVTRMRVINVETTGVISSTGTYTWGETEDYLVNISSFNPTLTYSWSPAGDFSNPTAANTTYIGTSAGANVITLSIVDTVSGCSNTDTRTIYINPVPAAPTCAGDTICGPGNVTLTAVGSGGELFWTAGSAGNILAVNDTLVQSVIASGSASVREFPNNLDTTSVGYNPIVNPSAPVGYFPTTAQGMWFRVTNTSGTIIKSVDIYPNGPIGSAYGIAIIDSLGNTIGSVSGVTTVTVPNYETIELNIFVPYSTIPYAMRPIASPNFAVHQNGTVSSTSPWTIPGEITILAYGNMPPAASYFGATTFGMFYNWQVMYGCFGAACVANYVVNPAPALSITAGGPTSFCDSGSVSLDAGIASDPSYVNFNWSPATGLSATTGAVVTANVSTTTTYTVTADDGIVDGCSNTATVTLTVNTAPFATAGVVPDTICTTSPLQLNGSGGSSSYKYVGTTQNPGQTAGWPFNGANLTQRMQVFVSAAELNAAGVFGPTFLNSVGFQVANKLSNQPYSNFTVRVDTIPSGFGCFFSTTNYNGGTTTFNGSVSTVLGWNDIVFTTPYAWDGVHDIVINTCFTNATTSFFDIVYTSATPGCNSTNATNASACSATTGTLAALRPNLRFQGGAVNYSWSPATELNNALIANPLFTQSLGQGPRQYVLSVTDPSNGCVATDTANFYVSPTPIAPSIAFAGVDTTICNSGTMSFTSVSVDGTLQWQSSTDGINFFDEIGANNPTFTSSVISSDTYYRLKAYCTDSSYSNIKYVQVFNPTITFSEGDTVCGQGTVTLNATANPGYFIRWYADSTSGSYLANGSPYSTFLTQTDTFWVAALVDTLVGSGGDTLTSTFAGGNGANGNFFNVNVTSPVTLTGMRINNNSAGAVCEVWYRSGTHVGFEGSSAGWTQIFNGPVAAAQGYVTGLNLPLTTGITSFFVFLPGGGITYTNGVNFGGVVSSDANLAILEGYGTGGTFGAGLFGPPTGTRIWNGSLIYAVPNCVSARVPVIAVVNPAPSVTVSPTAVTICEGSSINIDATDVSSAYTNFNWTPATGLNVTSGLSVIATPLVTTTYTVTASGNIDGCETSATSVITVNPAPVFTLSPSTQNLCNGDTAAASIVVTSPTADTYVLSSVPYAPLTPAGSSGWGAGPSGDDLATTISLPFSFTYFGANYNSINLVTNGYAYFGANVGFGPYGSAIPNAGAPNNVIALAWEDLNVTSPDSIRYYTVGATPNRRFVMEWIGVDFWPSGGNVSGQIVLNEGSNTIDMYIANVDNLGNSTACGIENATGSYGLTPAGRNFSVWTPNPVVNEAWRFTPVPAASIQWAGQNIIGSTTGTSIQALPTSSGYYTATVTNPLTGCTKVDSVAVNFNVSPSPQIVENDTTLCNPDQIYIHVADVGAYSGGYPAGTTFEWSAIGVPIVDLDSISSNNGSSYSVIVTLPSGCSAGSDTITVLTKSVAVVENISNATCSGGGSIAVTVTSGIADFNYVWSTDLAQTNIVRNVTITSNQDTLANIAAGTYYLQVYDEAGTPASCNSGILTYVVGGAAQIVASVTPTDITCNGNANGAADVTWTGGVSPFSITWSDGNFANTTPRGISIGGNYSVIVSDMSGCADTVDFVIVEPLPVSVTFTSTPESFPGALDGTATATPAGGTGPYTLLWADEFFAPAGSGNPLTGVAAGLYYGLVTDANGCDNSATVLGDSIRIDVISSATFNLTVLIEGFYDGLGGLTPALLNSGVGLSATECDTIYVELRDQLSPTTVLASGIAVLNTSGQASFTFPGAVIGQNGYIAVFHRNAVQTWSDVITFAGLTNYNFTTAATQAFGSNQVQLAPGVFAMYSGDLSPQDEFIDLLDQGVIDNDIFNFAGGYVVSDLNGDGFVDLVDQSIVDNNIFNFIGSVHP